MAEKKSFLLRLDPELYDALRRWAEAELRSVNGQIEWILRDASEKRKGSSATRGKPREGTRG
jgi:hypothetical protein